MSAPGASFADHPEASRYELVRDGELLGWVDYRPGGRSVIVAHTEVAEGHEREGIGGELVRRALEAIEAGGRTVIPTCPFAAAWIGRHPEFARIVDPAMRAQYAAG